MTYLVLLSGSLLIPFFFFFNDTATTEIYTLSLHDALPILPVFFRRLPMQRFRSRWAAKGVLLAAAALATAAGAWGATTTRGSSHSSSASATLVVDRSFEIKTADPQRAFEPTAAIVDRGLYDTFFTYRGNDLAHPIPLLVKTWTASKNAKTFVFHLRTNVHFADGTPLPAKDPGFHVRRLA